MFLWQYRLTGIVVPEFCQLSQAPVQVQRHGVPDLTPVLLAADPAAAGPGLVPGRPLLHPPVPGVQPRDSPRGQVLQVCLCHVH